MELKYLQTFHAILETGSFLNAARQLNYTQSTVTFHIQQLEQELSFPLFEKIGRKMQLTQAGREIIPYVDAILQNVEILENFQKQTQELHGKLRVALPESLLTYQMQPVLQAFREQAPHVQLSLQSLNCYTIRDRIVEGSVDIGVHYDVGGYGAALKIEKIKSFPLVLAVHPSLSEEDRDFITPRQQKQVSLLINDPHSIYQKRLDRYLKEKQISLAGTLEVGSLEATKRSMISNLGVAYLPRFVVEEELQQEILKEIPTDIQEQTVTAVCVYHQNKWMTPAMELFIKLLREKW